MYKPTLHAIKTNNITPAILTKEHYKLMTQYLNSGKKSSNNTHTGFDSELYHLAKKSKLAADVIPRGSQQLTFGPFSSSRVTLPKMGDTVTIPKGATIYSMHPVPAKEVTVSKRNRTVTLSSVQAGYYDTYAKTPNQEFTSSKLQWAGSGGYWHWIKLDDTPDFWQQKNNSAYITDPLCEACGQELRP